MNRAAIINGVEYTLIETLPGLDGGTAIVCQDRSGNRLACPEKLWLESVPPEPPVSSVLTTNSTAQEKIAFFLSLFRGRGDVYAKRYYNFKSEKSGYVPACKNEWAPGLCDKRAHKCPECPNRAFLPLTENVIRAHLQGRDPYCRDVAGLYPLREDDTTWLLAMDFDDASWKDDAAAVRDAASEIGLTPAVERSQSGNGAHIWFFFSEAVSAGDARRMGSGLLTRAMSLRRLERTDFPLQARLTLSNMVYIDKTGFSQAALNAVKRLAAFRNPEFAKKQAMRLRIDDTPRVFDCSFEDADFLGLPRGCLEPLRELLESFDVPFIPEDDRQRRQSFKSYLHRLRYRVLTLIRRSSAARFLEPPAALRAFSIVKRSAA